MAKKKTKRESPLKVIKAPSTLVAFKDADSIYRREIRFSATMKGISIENNCGDEFTVTPATAKALATALTDIVESL